MLDLPSLPKPSATCQLRVYFPRRRNRVEKLERKSRLAAITLDEIRAAPSQFVMLARPSLIEDFDGDLPEGTQLLFGMWSGYREEPEWQKTMPSITKANGKFLDCHASGHASPEGLFDFVEELVPKRIAPVHTLAPQSYAIRFPRTEIILRKSFEL